MTKNIKVIVCFFLFLRMKFEVLVCIEIFITYNQLFLILFRIDGIELKTFN